MAQEVFQGSGCSSYEDWQNQLKSKSVNARYRFTVRELDALLFMFIRSLRSADFDSFRRCLKEIILWMLALDRVHYSRWLWVFLHALERLEDTNENIFRNFMEGRFVVNKSGRPFSCIAEDQAHEQNKWAINGPVLTKVLEQGETKKLGKNAHHEDTWFAWEDFPRRIIKVSWKLQSDSKSLKRRWRMLSEYWIEACFK